MSNEGNPRRTGTPLLADVRRDQHYQARDFQADSHQHNRRVEALLGEILAELRELNRRIVRD
jgi:hypothetical protein